MSPAVRRMDDIPIVVYDVREILNLVLREAHGPHGLNLPLAVVIAIQAICFS